MSFVLDQKKKIGYFIRSWIPGDKQDKWEDGQEMKSLKQDLENVIHRKHKIEK